MFWFFDPLFPLASCMEATIYLYCVSTVATILPLAWFRPVLYQQEYYHILLICQTQGFLLVPSLPWYPFKYANLMQICKFVLKNYLSIRVKSMLWHRSLFLIRTSHLSLVFFFFSLPFPRATKYVLKRSNWQLCGRRSGAGRDHSGVLQKSKKWWRWWDEESKWDLRGTVLCRLYQVYSQTRSRAWLSPSWSTQQGGFP